MPHMRTKTYSRLAIMLAPAAILFTAGTANAATCEEAFVKKGNAITGLRFTAAVTVADLPPAVAIGRSAGSSRRKAMTSWPTRPNMDRC
jgi:hypothetical protein